MTATDGLERARPGPGPRARRAMRQSRASRTGRRGGWRRRGDDGAVGGAEVLPLAVLVFVVGSLLMANLWAVLDARVAAEAAARDAVRRYVEAPDGATATVAAHDAARASIEGLGRDPDRLQLTIEHPDGRAFGRCVPVVVAASYEVPMALVPLGQPGPATRRVTARQAERIDPWRSGLAGPAAC